LLIWWTVRDSAERRPAEKSPNESLVGRDSVEPDSDVKDLRLRFSNHLARIFVLTQSQKNRLPQLSITRPFGELDLANEF
jgi:hypothetical protein